MKLTPLHIALGANSGDLSIELIREACTQGADEREDLDWKKTLPLTLPADNTSGRDEQQNELAKDIAAMANTKGGLVVYGVAETGKSNAASKIVSVGTRNEVTERNIRWVAFNLIHPPVTGLLFHWLTAHDSDESILALEIARSTEAPHLVRPKKQPHGTGFWFAVPYRHGPDTEWMPEKMIESAYRDRLANRRQREQDLRELHADLVLTATALTGNTSVVAVARPENPLPASPRILDQAKAARIFDQAWHSSWHHYLHSVVAADYMLRDAETKHALQRFRQWENNLVQTGSGGINQTAIAEVHFDGSVGIALSRGGAFDASQPAESRALATVDLDQAALNLFTLAYQAARELQIPGDFEVRLSVEPPLSRFRHPSSDRPGAFRPYSEQDQIPPFQPVEGAFLFSEGLDVALSSLSDIASDAVNQTGTNSLLNARDLESEYAYDGYYRPERP